MDLWPAKKIKNIVYVVLLIAPQSSSDPIVHLASFLTTMLTTSANLQKNMAPFHKP